MNFDWSTFLFQTANFGILVWLLHRFLYKPVLAMVDARQQEIRQTLADAQASRQTAKTELAALEAQRVEIAKEREAALAAAADEAETAAKTRMARAEQESIALMDHARKTLSEERDKALADATDLAGNLAVSIAGHLVAEAPLEARISFWLDRLARDLEARPAREREELAHELAPDRPLRILTPQALSAEESAPWRERFAGIFGVATAIVFETDATLAAGAELHFPHAVLRFSWKSELDRVRTEIQSHADHP